VPELERLIADARPEWPDPLDGAEDRILGGLGLLEPPRGPGAWLRRAPRSRRLRLFAAAALLAGSGAAIAVALTGGGSAAAGPAASLDFGPPETVGDVDPFGGGAALAVDAGGTVTAAWSRAGRVFAATRPPAGGWSAPERLSDPGVRAVRPEVAAGPAGRAVVVWRERAPGRVVRRSFTLPGGAPAGTLQARVDVRWRVVASVVEGGTWGAPEAVSPPTAAVREVYAPQVVMSRGGQALVGFTHRGRVWVAAARTGEWSPPVAISPRGGFPADLLLVGDPASGRALATWSLRSDDPTDGRRWQVWAAPHAPGEGWDARPLAAPALGKPFPTGAIDGRGRAAVAWIARAPWAIVRAASGDWSAPERLLPDGDVSEQYPPVAGIDGTGRAVVALVGDRRSALLARAGAGDWRRIAGVTSPFGPFGLGLVTDPAGNLVVADPMHRVAATTVRAVAAGGAAGAPATVSGFWLPGLLAVGGDGTTAIGHPRRRDGRTELIVRVARGEARP
jgi:hypothetical protein